jgi:hypothetical protein
LEANVALLRYRVQKRDGTRKKRKVAGARGRRVKRNRGN